MHYSGERTRIILYVSAPKPDNSTNLGPDNVSKENKMVLLNESDRCSCCKWSYHNKTLTLIIAV